MMEAQQILIIILAIVAFDYLFNQLLDYMNLKARRPKLPAEVESFYDEDKYAKSQEYHQTLSKFSFISAAFSFLLSFGILYGGAFGYLDELLRHYISNELYLSLAFFGVIYILSDILNLPFALYATFVIEERFGFNKTTPKIFLIDKLKGYLLTLLIGAPLLAALIYLVTDMGSNFWLYFWAIATLFILFANMFYTTLILPLFNKLTPLQDGELKSAIEDYSKKINFPLDSIYVIDGSKRSSKANAFFSGIGKKKKIVLYDTLINNHTIEELVAVLAHEVGHFKKKHIVTGLIFSVLQIGVMLFIMSKMIYSSETSMALGGAKWSIHLNLLAFGILYSPISMILGLIGNVISRKNEFDADEYAKNTFSSEALRNALKKLSVDNLSNLFPHPAYVFIHYSHPPLLQRLEKLKQ